MLWPHTVELDGASIPLEGVLADLTIRRGRMDVGDEPTADTCQLTLLDVDQALVAAFEVGQALTVTVSDDGGSSSSPRFTGFVTDARLDVDSLTVIAAGALSKLRLYVVGEVSWPVESWSSRVTRAFTEAGLLAQLELEPDPLFNPQLAARDPVTAGPTTLGDYLTFLAGMVGALVSDRPNGDIFVQAVGARVLDAAVALDPDDVAYAPVWVQELPRGNIVTVRYTGDQSEHVTVTDAASVAIYGERPETIDTAFVNAADATYRANQRLGRGAYAHWNVPEAPILRGLELELGAPVELDNMPAASPNQPWTPILEGWSDTITGGDWTMALSLSDPLLSGLTLPWAAVPLELAWNETDPATNWTEALTLDDLEL